MPGKDFQTHVANGDLGFQIFIYFKDDLHMSCMSCSNVERKLFQISYPTEKIKKKFCSDSRQTRKTYSFLIFLS